MDLGNDAADRHARTGAAGRGMLRCALGDRGFLPHTLKSGCRLEERRFERMGRVLPCLALCLLVAWRTRFVCRMGREGPDADCECIFEPSEWKAVWVAVHKK